MELLNRHRPNPKINRWLKKKDGCEIMTEWINLF